MFSQLLSVSDLEKLKAGDRISDHPESSLGKMYTVGNISQGLIYAIYDTDNLELKIFKRDEMPAGAWWVYDYPEPSREVVSG